MNFGKTILELRKKKNVTQEEMAAELGVTAAAVSKWENNYTLPDILMLCALADYFEVTTDELLGRAKQWKFAVIAAETEALGQRIASLAKAYGIASRGIFTDFNEAMEAARQDADIHYAIAGFYSGWYEADASASLLVSVHSNDEQILDALQLVFEKYLHAEDKQFIIN